MIFSANMDQFVKSEREYLSLFVVFVSQITILYAYVTSDLLFRGNTPETRGTAYVVYEDIFDAKNACDHLSGFNVCNRYLVVLYYNANRVSLTEIVVALYSRCRGNFKPQCVLLVSIFAMIYIYLLSNLQAFQKMDTKKKEEQLKLLKEKYGINTDPPK